MRRLPARLSRCRPFSKQTIRLFRPRNVKLLPALPSRQFRDETYGRESGTLLVIEHGHVTCDKEHDMVQPSIFAAVLFISFFMFAYYQE